MKKDRHSTCPLVHVVAYGLLALVEFGRLAESGHLPEALTFVAYAVLFASAAAHGSRLE